MSARSLKSFVAPAAILCAGLAMGAVFSDTLRPSQALAQDAQTRGETPFNSGEQRRQMIQQLTQVNERLTRIEAQLSKGISVKVTEMPASKDSK